MNFFDIGKQKDSGEQAVCMVIETAIPVQSKKEGSTIQYETSFVRLTLKSNQYDKTELKLLTLGSSERYPAKLD